MMFLARPMAWRIKLTAVIDDIEACRGQNWLMGSLPRLIRAAVVPRLSTSMSADNLCHGMMTGS